MIDDLRHFRASRPRHREYFWAAIAAALYALGSSGSLEEEGARRAPADRQPPGLFAGDPRELHRLEMVWPLGCFPPEGQWIRQWGDGRTPYEAHPATGQRPFVCVDADLRRLSHVHFP